MAASSGVTVRVVFNHCDAVAAAYHAGAIVGVKSAGYAIEAAGKARAPVLTGTLRRSIHTVLSDGGLRATVGPSVLYGKFVELGTRRMAARPYMRPAAELVFPKFRDDIRLVLRKAA